ncbi:recombinase family protein [Acidiphilium sp.]|uniref:recombinase family protein n=1 Tax=Acidiphilium sp. TaxID=527 RepID=UPI00338D7D90
MLLLDACGRSTHRTTFYHPERSSHLGHPGETPITPSGGRWDRPELHRLLDHLREGDTVVVWKLDRLSRCRAR